MLIEDLLARAQAVETEWLPTPEPARSSHIDVIAAWASRFPDVKGQQDLPVRGQ